MIFTAFAPRLIQSISCNVHNKIRALNNCEKCDNQFNINIIIKKYYKKNFKKNLSHCSLLRTEILKPLLNEILKLLLSQF